MLKILTKRERIILYATLGVIIFAVFFNLLILPVLNKNYVLSKEINITRLRLKKYLQLLSQKEEIQNRYTKVSGTFRIPTQEEDTLVSTLSELENLAKQANIRILDLRPQVSPKAAAMYKEVLIELRAEGTMTGYLKFIYSLENSLLLLRIKEFRLMAKPNSPILEGTFSISHLSLSE